jgi:hypothetical protein
MTMQKNRPLVAIPNVLRNETVPNRLRGMGIATAPAVVRRSGLPVGLAALVIGGVVAVAWFLVWQTS